MKVPDNEHEMEIETLFDGIAPDSPFADEVESFLAEGEIIPFEESELNEVVDALERRFREEQVVQPTLKPANTVWAWAALAAIALLAVGTWAFVTHDGGPTPPEMAEHIDMATPAAFVPDGEALALSDGARYERVDDVLRLDAGTVRFVREDGLMPSVAQVHLSGVGIDVIPVGTRFVAGISDDLAVVGVQHGEVALRGTDGEIARLLAGEWAIVGSESRVISFREGSQPAADVISAVGDADVAQSLLVSMRWMAMPERTVDALDNAGK